MFCSILGHYKCFYCKGNLRNGFLMPDSYEKVVLFVLYVLIIGSKVMEIINFCNSRLTKSKMAAK